MGIFFDFLIKFYKAIYLFAYDNTGNYGLALVLLSLFTFIVLYPFNKKAKLVQNKEYKIQSILVPQINAIKKQYCGHEQYEQLQWLYRRYGYHPLYAIRSATGLFLQIPFLTAAYYMLSGLVEIQGVSWGVIPNLGSPDHLLGGINVLPFVMTVVTVFYAFVIPKMSQKERLQTVAIGFFFLVLLYNAPSALIIFWSCNLLWSLLDTMLSGKLAWLGNWYYANELAFHIIFALSLTVGFLVPTDIYVKNASQLWFAFKDILKYFIADTVNILFFLIVVYAICWHKRIRLTYLSILLGLLAAVFLQCYIIGLDYGAFDGHEIEWSNYSIENVLNLFVWFACIGGAFLKFRKNYFNVEKIIRFVKPLTFVIIVIQCVVLLLSLVGNPVQKNIVLENEKIGLLTNKELYSVSANNNIIVFLIDTFDASIFEEIMLKNPEVIADLKDFKFYPDTTSSFGFTDFSLPEILTGKLYDPSTRYPDYLNKAWDDNQYYRILKENKYTVNLYTSGNYVASNASIDNLIAEKLVMNAIVADTFSDLVKFRIVPHCLKQYYYRYHIGLQTSAIHNINVKPYNGEDDISFYTGLKRGLQLTDKKVFKFYHLSGIHPPYEYNEKVEPLKLGEKGTAYKQALGALKIVSEYIAQMKRHNLYNSATIAILSDHGFHKLLARRPVFLFKYPGNSNKELTIDGAPNTVSSLMPRIIMGINKTEKENLIPAIGKDRFFYFVDDKETGSAGFIKYLVKSPAKDINSWILLGNLKKMSILDRTYKLNEIIDFSCFGNSYKYKTVGWGDREWDFASTINKRYAEIELRIEDIDFKKKDLVIHITCNPLLNHFSTTDGKSINPLSYRDIKLYANHNLAGSWRFTSIDTATVSCKISVNIVKDLKLNLRFSIENPPNSNQPELFQINKIWIEQN